MARTLYTASLFNKIFADDVTFIILLGYFLHAISWIVLAGGRKRGEGPPANYTTDYCTQYALPCAVSVCFHKHLFHVV